MAALLLAMAAAPALAAEWSEEVPVRAGSETVLRFRARIVGDFLVVQASHAPGWHSYAMDNALREKEALAGKPSLGTELGLRIDVESGGAPQGAWLQSAPKDLSQPELRHYTWGFGETATFALPFQREGSAPVVLAIVGQVCNDQTCRNINVDLTIPPAPAGNRDTTFSLDQLVPVRTK